jgi:hypothetical protein
MHPRKAECLHHFDEASGHWDTVIRQLIGVAAQPRKYGWLSLAAATVALPTVGVAAVLNDLAHVSVARSGDDEWRRAFPDEPA